MSFFTLSITLWATHFYLTLIRCKYCTISLQDAAGGGEPTHKISFGRASLPFLILFSAPNWTPTALWTLPLSVQYASCYTDHIILVTAARANFDETPAAKKTRSLTQKGISLYQHSNMIVQKCIESIWTLEHYYCGKLTTHQEVITQGSLDIQRIIIFICVDSWNGLYLI